MPAAPESLNTNFAAIPDSIFIDIREDTTDRLSVSSGSVPLKILQGKIKGLFFRAPYSPP